MSAVLIPGGRGSGKTHTLISWLVAQEADHATWVGSFPDLGVLVQLFDRHPDVTDVNRVSTDQFIVDGKTLVRVISTVPNVSRARQKLRSVGPGNPVAVDNGWYDQDLVDQALLTARDPEKVGVTFPGNWDIVQPGQQGGEDG